MSDTNYSHWYRNGTVSAQNNSKIISGVDSYWLNASLKPGDIFTFDGNSLYEIDTIDSQTQITLKTPYLGSNTQNATYGIIRNFTATMPAEIAAKAASVLEKHERYINEDLKEIQGQSAYEVAVSEGFVGTKADWLISLNAYGRAKANGYTGTESEWLESLSGYGIAVKNGYTGTQKEWLESLKAAGEWDNANTRLTQAESNITIIKKRTDYLDEFAMAEDMYSVNSQPNRAGLRNSQYRGKCLGSTITAAQWASIKDGSFEDMYPGDYWEMTVPEKYNKDWWDNYGPVGNNRRAYFPDNQGFCFWPEKPDRTFKFIIMGFNLFKAGTASNGGENYGWGKDNWCGLEITDTNWWGKMWNGYHRANHIVVMSNDLWYLPVDYDTNKNISIPTSGGYFNSEFRQGDNCILKPAYEIARDIFGQEHLHFHYENLSSACDENNNITAEVVKIMCIDLPSEVELLGTRIYSGNLPTATRPIQQFPAMQHMTFPSGVNNMCTRDPALGKSDGYWVTYGHSGDYRGLQMRGDGGFVNPMIPLYQA